MTNINISLPQLQVFFFIFLRVGAIIMTVPVFDSKNIPILFKAGLVFAISIILFPILKLDNAPFTAEAIPFGIGIIGEIMLGVTIGLSVRLIFAGIQLAGQVAGFQMGFAIANIMDPVASAQVPVIAALKNLIAMLIFLAVNAHHWFLRALVDSFRLVPPFGFQFTNSLMEHLVRLGGNMFIIAIKVGAPIMAVMLLTSVAFGLIARTVPQMHIFIVAIPVKILIGLLFLVFSLPFFSFFLKQIFNGLGNDIILLLRAM
ncbi:MAG: flagellar biosynthetic protein FliR [Deltaproteobacteria bacterium]|nr:flagellar biosynthetic protein FliR [Deltaproteobacteria bacterium]MBW1736391.1 flagellar biosynthetic protein FliR [Deltaproteobacteria bacterium]MBW1908130.1 flagellar biosynthetic protein FliR [Deltaproteobacteria bacterium]MBW2032209.1 flagellar biosynthetic protein FliR [Deltaproteobacteria bacterium]MBW2113782.1 flagellar biosynthetic protein FliR [Deltaproteobacteria bacterium]